MSLNPDDPAFWGEPPVEGEVLPAVRVKWTPGVQEECLALLAEKPSPSWVAARLGIHVQTIYHHRRTKPEFRRRYDLVMADSIDALIGQTLARARDVEDPDSANLAALFIRLMPERISYLSNLAQDGQSDEGEGGIPWRILTRLPQEDQDALVAIYEKAWALMAEEAHAS